MKKIKLMTLSLGVLMIGVLLAFTQPVEEKVEVVDDKIHWMSFEEAIAAAQEEPKKVLIDIYTTWCGPCKMMDRNTLSHPEIVEYVNDNFYAVKLNAEMKDTVRIGEQTLVYVPSGRRGYHQLAAALVAGGRLAYPTMVVLDEQLKNVGVAPGYKDPQTMDKFLRFFEEGHYKVTKWQMYEKTTKSRIKNISSN